ncbi:MAG TPA: metal-dependent hydrolase [Chloroflexota bacterium]|nr:metal-dependent hydrolase [Chloroflexota bacterium]
MQGGTHLAFGTAASLALVGLGGVGLGAGVVWDHVSLPFTSGHAHQFAYPNLPPITWAALAAAAAIGSLLPDIDQPGSLITRMPGRQGKALRRATRAYSDSPLGGPARLTVDSLAASTNLISALLGGSPGRGSFLGRFLLTVLLIAFSAGAVMARWLPPAALLSWPLHSRHLLALILAGLAAAALLLLLGGVAGLVHRLPGHHRGWTHTPPVALALTAAALVVGPGLAPSLRGVGAAFAAGYISHLLADALTIRGIPLWLPGQAQPSLHLLPGPLRIRTGGAGERLFNLCWPVILVGLVTWRG